MSRNTNDFIKLLRPARRQARPRRIGIYVGAFDPVHAGHVAFALQSLRAARLDEVIFLPERRPRFKPSVEHYAHRVVMLQQALQPHPDLAVMEMVDRHYSVGRTLPQLRALFSRDQLVFLMGSDAALSVPAWPLAKHLLMDSELVIGVRSQHQHAAVDWTVQGWEMQPKGLTIVDSFAPDVSSSSIRQALRAGTHTKGLLTSVKRYARQEWLYVSPGNIV